MQRKHVEPMRRVNVLLSQRTFDKVYALANRMFRANVSLALDSVLLDYFEMDTVALKQEGETQEKTNETTA